MNAALLISALYVKTAAAAARNAIAPVDYRIVIGAGVRDHRTWDVGCIGYHGSGSGYVKSGKCLVESSGNRIELGE